MAAIRRLGLVAPSLNAKQSLGFLSIRAFGSAAAAVQYDYDDYEEEYEERRLATAMIDAEGWAPERGVQWVMIGEPGARRHFLAERLSKLLQVPHISTGNLVRQELSPRSSLYSQIANSLNEGKLVPEEIIFGLLTRRLEEGYSRGEAGFILDGIPRTRIQAEILDQIVHVDLVVNFKCSDDNLVKNKEVQVQTHCGRSLEQSVHKHAESKSLEDYYKKQKKLLNFEVAGAPGETWQGLLAALHLQHINAISSSPQKLTA